MHTHHDDADADADPADDVQLAVEHLVNSCRTALMTRGGRGRGGGGEKNILETKDYNNNNNRGPAVCVRPVTVVMRTSSPSFLGQMSLAASITVPVGPQQFSCEQEVTLVTIIISSRDK